MIDTTCAMAFDACYHPACDRYPGNIDTTALEITSNAANRALWRLAAAPVSSA